MNEIYERFEKDPAFSVVQSKRGKVSLESVKRMQFTENKASFRTHRQLKGINMRIAAILFIICLSFSAQAQADESQPTPYAGSSSCRECHEKLAGMLWIL